MVIFGSDGSVQWDYDQTTGVLTMLTWQGGRYVPVATYRPGDVGLVRIGSGPALMQEGTLTGLSAGAAGVVTSAAAYGAAFPTATDLVLLSITNPSSQGIGFGGEWSTGVGPAGFTANVNIVTAVAGATFNVNWIALGH